jgi:hypothetical protein
MKNGAVVSASLDQIQEIPCGHRSGIPIELKRDRALAGRELDGGLALKARTAGLVTAEGN